MFSKTFNESITSMAFHQESPYLATSSYSGTTIEILKIENNAISSERKITLSGENNPINSLFWSNDSIICIDNYAKQISKINSETGEILSKFTHLHSRGFETIDQIKHDNENIYLVASKKIHPPTIEKLNLDIDHKKLENIFILDSNLALIQSCSLLGNIIQAKFNPSQNNILVVSKYLDGTTLFILDMSLNIIKKVNISPEKAISAFIAINNEISIVLQIGQNSFKTIYSRFDCDLTKKIEYKEYKDSYKVDQYINSIFGYNDMVITEIFTRDNDKSNLIFYNVNSNKIVGKTESYGFMETMAFNEKYIAWSENNKIKVVKTA
ncbi:hypothetical protein [Acinetobacter gyllenbergii]|uniref:hypothetical protein n=1 Tax=Acinetobacter gyllenbergii TaxID=134534 RepID=UPI003F54C482